MVQQMSCTKSCPLIYIYIYCYLFIFDVDIVNGNYLYDIYIIIIQVQLIHITHKLPVAKDPWFDQRSPHPWHPTPCGWTHCALPQTPSHPKFATGSNPGQVGGGCQGRGHKDQKTSKGGGDQEVIYILYYGDEYHELGEEPPK